MATNQDESPRRKLNLKASKPLVALLIPLLTCTTPSRAQASPLVAEERVLELDQFLRLFLHDREELAQAEAELRQAEMNLRVRSDFWATEVGLRPLLNYRLQENSSADQPLLKFSERLNTLSGEINQELPYGLLARLEGLKNILPPNENVPSQDYQYAATLSVPLWRNAMGRLQKLEQSGAEAQLEQATEALQNRLQDECLNGFQTYIESFTESERYRVAQEKLRVANEALKVSEQSWAKKLIREIDVLSARSNFLSTQIDWKLSQKTASVALSNLFLTTRSLVDLVQPKTNLRLKPPVIDEAAPLNPPQLETHPQVRAAQLALESARLEWQAERERRRSEVNLSIAAGSSQGRTAGVRFFNFNEEFLRVFLDFRLPINRRDSAAIESSYQRSLFQSAEIERIKKVLEIQWQDSKEQYEADRERLKWSEQSIGYHRQRLKRAQTLLKAGRMPFDEFIRYNDSLFLEEERKLTLHRELLRNHLSLLLLSQQLPRICKGFRS